MSARDHPLNVDSTASGNSRSSTAFSVTTTTPNMTPGSTKQHSGSSGGNPGSAAGNSVVGTPANTPTRQELAAAQHAADSPAMGMRTSQSSGSFVSTASPFPLPRGGLPPAAAPANRTHPHQNFHHSHHHPPNAAFCPPANAADGTPGVHSRRPSTGATSTTHRTPRLLVGCDESLEGSAWSSANGLHPSQHRLLAGSRPMHGACLSADSSIGFGSPGTAELPPAYQRHASSASLQRHSAASNPGSFRGIPGAARTFAAFHAPGFQSPGVFADESPLTRDVHSLAGSPTGTSVLVLPGCERQPVVESRRPSDDSPCGAPALGFSVSTNPPLSHRHADAAAAAEPDDFDGLEGTSSQAELLGRGAFGQVFRVEGHDRRTGAAVDFARKVMPLAAGVGHADAHVLTPALRTEIRISKRLSRCGAPALVTIFGVRVGHTEATIDMELLDAGPLSRFAPMRDEACVAAVARELLLGLKALHGEVRALHRDIKLQNILASRAGAVKLVDFGSAAVLPDDAPADAPLVAEDQQGTILQMSPERLRGEPHGPASDVWSVGVTIAELATGRHPFLPAEKGGLASTERFWALAEVIKHTATAEECAAATDVAISAAVADCGAELRSFVCAAVRAEASERATVEELLAHPFLTSPAALAVELQSVFGRSANETVNSDTAPRVS